MRRREFIAGLGGAVAWPLGAFAQQGDRVLRICMSLWLAVLPLSSVADAADFYQDKTITFIIGSGPGGGYDTYSRLIAGHLGRHIGGQPTIVPQDVPGAGSIRAANYLYSFASKDGTTIGMVDEAILLNQILGVQEPTTDAAKLSWFGRILRRIMRTPEARTDAVKFNWIGRVLANSDRRGFDPMVFYLRTAIGRCR